MFLRTSPGVESLETRRLLSTLHVGPAQSIKTLAAAAGAAIDGDVIQVDAGLYSGANAVAVFTQDNLIIEGVGGKAHLDAAGYVIPNQKAIFVIAGANTTIRNIEFSGASVPDDNGAGIRQEGKNLTVENCYFHHNQDGILSGADDGSVANASTISIFRSEFAHNGAGDGFSHNIYIGGVSKFILRESWTHDAVGGQLIKSRAKDNSILYNRITDETGESNYQIDLPNGAPARIIGNLIQKSPTDNNHTMLSYGAEGLGGFVNEMYVTNNTFVLDQTPGTFVFVASGAGFVRLQNNIFCGNGTVVSGAATQNSNLVTTGDPGFVNKAVYDYRLMPGASNAIDKGTAPINGSPQGVGTITVDRQYLHLLNGSNRAVFGASIDIGAFEYAPSGVITGNVFNDNNSNGLLDAGETPLAARTIYLDANNNSKFDFGETSVTTDAAGNYSFTNLTNGTYSVKQVLASGFRKTLPGAGIPGQTRTVNGDTQIANFAATTKILLAGKVFNDANSNGTQNAGETGIANVVVNIISNGSTVATRTTDATGAWRVQGLSAGTGSAEIVIPAGYAATNPAAGKYSGAMSSGQANTNLNFGLHQTAAAVFQPRIEILDGRFESLALLQ